VEISWPLYRGQLTGAVVASTALLGVFGASVQLKTHLAATYPAANVSILSALGIELIATFFLMLVIMSVATDGRAESATTGLSIGLALYVGVLVTGSLTGGALNPARALGPMIVAGKFTDFWIYIIGPIIGATLAAVVYDKILKEAIPPDEAE
jgi:glycerol uptake facilitator-like aquaporin